MQRLSAVLRVVVIGLQLYREAGGLVITALQQVVEIG